MSKNKNQGQGSIKVI